MQLRERGQSLRQLAQTFNVSKTTIFRYLRLKEIRQILSWDLPTDQNFDLLGAVIALLLCCRLILLKLQQILLNRFVVLLY